MFTQVLTDISFDDLKMPPTLMERQDVKISFQIVFQLVLYFLHKLIKIIALFFNLFNSISGKKNSKLHLIWHICRMLTNTFDRSTTFTL